MKTDVVQLSADKIAETTGFTPEQIAIIKANVAKGTTDGELAFFASVCKSSGLDPLNKEIWCYKDNKGNLLIFAGRDGFLKKAQTSARWNGLSSDVVYSNDECLIDVPNGIVEHKHGIADRGQLLGAYAIVKPKDAEQVTIEWAEFDVYNRAYAPIWKSNPAVMIKKVAETHALKKAFGITGLAVEYDFDTTDGVALPVVELRVKDELETAKEKIREMLETYQGDDKEEIRTMCSTKQNKNEFDIKFANNIIKQLS